MLPGDVAVSRTLTGCCDSSITASSSRRAVVAGPQEIKVRTARQSASRNEFEHPVEWEARVCRAGACSCPVALDHGVVDAEPPQRCRAGGPAEARKLWVRGGHWTSVAIALDEAAGNESARHLRHLVACLRVAARDHAGEDCEYKASFGECHLQAECVDVCLGL